MEGQHYETRDARVGVVLGVAGLGAGIGSALTGVGILGLFAGIAAAAGPAMILGAQRSRRPSTSAGVEPVEQPEAEQPVIEPPNATAPSPPSQLDGALLGPEHFDVAVENRIKAARRFLKPLSVVQLHIDGGPATQERFGAVVLETLRDCDIACGLAGDRIALLLEDTPENGAVWAVERIRRSLSEIDASVKLWAGIACYPAHALDSDEVLARCEEALVRAQEWPRDRIEVALAE
jgi:GGDEF domain-containing protein